jgi:hypothetical protein
MPQKEQAIAWDRIPRSANHYMELAVVHFEQLAGEAGMPVSVIVIGPMPGEATRTPTEMAWRVKFLGVAGYRWSDITSASGQEAQWQIAGEKEGPARALGARSLALAGTGGQPPGLAAAAASSLRECHVRRPVRDCSRVVGSGGAGRGGSGAGRARPRPAARAGPSRPGVVHGRPNRRPSWLAAANRASDETSGEGFWRAAKGDMTAMRQEVQDRRRSHPISMWRV